MSFELLGVHCLLCGKVYHLQEGERSKPGDKDSKESRKDSDC